MSAERTGGGPDIGPMRDGLPHSSASALRALLVNVIFQALADDDCDWACSDTFNAYATLAGLSPQVIFRVRLLLLLNRVDRRRLNVQCIDAARYGSKDPRGEGEPWDSWKSLPGA